jgi:GNAT superfamily N-acetyltransferase
VRFARASDGLELARLRWASRSDAEREREAFVPFCERFNSWLAAALVSDAWHVAVATGAGEQLVGCMYLQAIATVPVPGVALRRWGYVTHAYVDDAHRGRGTGTALLRLLVEQARALRLQELQVWPSARAVSLYTRAGFLSPESQRAGTEPDEPSHVLPLG